jgi:hypothetical protein
MVIAHGEDMIEECKSQVEGYFIQPWRGRKAGKGKRD